MPEVRPSPQDMPDQDGSGDLSPSWKMRKTPYVGSQSFQSIAPPQTEILERLAHRDARIADLVAALEQERMAQQDLRQDLAIRIEEITQLTIRTHESETELEAMRSDLDAVSAERDKLRNKLAKAVSKHDALRTSTSWKLTGPIRWISLQLRGHRG